MLSPVKALLFLAPLELCFPSPCSPAPPSPRISQPYCMVCDGIGASCPCPCLLEGLVVWWGLLLLMLRMPKGGDCIVALAHC